MFKQIKTLQGARGLCGLLLVLGLVACVLVGDVLAGGKGKGGGDDIILYNGNIVLRGGGKGKGKGGGSIVVANSPSQEYTPMMGWGGMFRRRR